MARRMDSSAGNSTSGRARRALCCVATASALFAATASAEAYVVRDAGGGLGAAASSAGEARASETEVVGRINRIRTGFGLRPLSVAVPLTRSARKHSLDMGLRHYLSHTTRGTGTQFIGRIQREEGRAQSRFYGETIGYVGELTGMADSIVRAWMASPPHRRILLDGRFRRIGVGAWRGTFDGQDDSTVYTANVTG